MKIILIILFFLVLGALLIISNNNLIMCNSKNIEVFSELCIEWINNIYINSQNLAGEVIRMNWLPK